MCNNSTSSKIISYFSKQIKSRTGETNDQDQMKPAVWMGTRMRIKNRKQLKIIQLYGKYTIRTRTNENRRAE